MSRHHRPVRSRAAASVALTLALASVLAGCGGEGSPATDPTMSTRSPRTPTTPAPTTTDGTATSSPSATPAPPAPPTPTKVVGLNSPAPRGSAPSVTYAQGAELHRPDAPGQTLPAVYDQVITLGDLVLGVRDDGAGGRVLDVVGDETTTSSPVSADVVVSRSQASVAWYAPDTGRLMTMWDGGRAAMRNDTGPVDVQAILGEGSCYEVDGGCAVFYDDPASGAPHVASSHGIVDIIAPHALHLADISGTGLAAVTTRATDDGSCSGVFNGHGSYLWRTCDYSLLDFSPDSRHLLGTAPYLDGLGLPSVSVLDSKTGRALVTYRVRSGTITGQVWEDDRHVLLVTYGALRWRVLRVDLRGHVEEAVAGATSADGTRPAYVLAGNVG